MGVAHVHFAHDQHVGKRAVSKRRHRCGQVDDAHILAAFKGMVVDGGHTVGDVHLVLRGGEHHDDLLHILRVDDAILHLIVLVVAFRQREAVQVRAVGQGTVADGRHRLGQQQCAQVGAAIEGLCGQGVVRQRSLAQVDGLQRGEVGQRLQVGSVQRAAHLDTADDDRSAHSLVGQLDTLCQCSRLVDGDVVGDSLCLSRRSNAENHFLLLAEGIDARIEQTDVVVAVEASVPSPVDMYQSVGVVAVEHEGVTALAVSIGCSIIERTDVAQLVEHHVAPVFLAIEVAEAHQVLSRHELCRLDAEVVDQSVGGIVGDGSREVETILHDGHHSHGMREVGHCLGLLFGIVALGIGVAHVAPVEVAGREVVEVVGACGVAVGHLQRCRSVTRLGVLMVVEYLSRCRSHTAHHTVARILLTVEQQGALVVERLLLSPLRREQGAHLGEILVGVGFHHARLYIIIYIVGSSLFHGGEPPLEAVVALCRRIAFLRIGHHFGQQVVGRDDGEATIGITHHGEVASLSQCQQLSLAGSLVHLAHLRLDCLGGSLGHLCLCSRLGLRRHHADESQCQRQGYFVDSHSCVYLIYFLPLIM